jgi:hypothetical protein
MEVDVSAGSSAMDVVSSWARAERREGTCETMSLSEECRRSTRGRVRLPMTVDHSLIGRSCDMRIIGMLGPFVLRWRSSVMCFWIRCFDM